MRINRLHGIVGWSLLVVFAVFAAWTFAGIRFGDLSSILAAIVIVTLVSAFTLLPGIMVLRKKWSHLASMLSAAICLLVFATLMHEFEFLAKRFGPNITQNKVLPVLLLLLAVLVFLVPVRLHRFLTPRFSRLLERKTDPNKRSESAPVESPPSNPGGVSDAPHR